jgi:hypothetical protein
MVNKSKIIVTLSSEYGSPRRVGTQEDRVWEVTHCYTALVLHTRCYPGHQTRDDEMAMACGAWGRGSVCTGFWKVNLQDRDHLEDIHVAEGRILKWMVKK